MTCEDNVSVKSPPPPPAYPGHLMRLAPYGGNLMRNVARPVRHLTTDEMLASGNKLKDYVEKAKATRLRKIKKVTTKQLMSYDVSLPLWSKKNINVDLRS